MTSVSNVEDELRRRFDAGDLDGTLTYVLEQYGDELLGFLVGLARDRAVADDALSATCERMWKGLPGFRWASSLRVWAYTIARNEFLRLATRTRREIPISEISSSAQALVQKIKSQGPAYEQTSVKAQFAAVRAALAPDDHMLLGLRLDRRLAWTEIAEVLGEPSDARTVAALRKRYERLKTKLRDQLVRA